MKRIKNKIAFVALLFLATAFIFLSVIGRGDGEDSEVVFRPSFMSLCCLMGSMVVPSFFCGYKNMRYRRAFIALQLFSAMIVVFEVCSMFVPFEYSWLQWLIAFEYFSTMPLVIFSGLIIYENRKP